MAAEAIALAWPSGKVAWLRRLGASWLVRQLEQARPRAAALLAESAESSVRNWVSLHQMTSRLRRRASLLESAWCVVFDTDREAPEVGARAARLVVATLDFAARTMKGKIPQEREGSKTLDPAQYRRIFAHSLRPGAEEDRVVAGRGAHLVVLAGGAIYVVDFLIDGRARRFEDWRSTLDAIVEDAAREKNAKSDEPASPAIGTAGRRDEWARLEQRLRATDEEALRTVEDALFVVALDDVSFDNDEAFGRHAYAHGFANRWYDAALQVVVTRGGRSAIVGNFALGIEGRAAWMLSREVAARAASIAVVDAAGTAAGYRRLAFHLDAEAKSALARVSRSVESSLTKAPSVFHIEGLNVDFFRELRVQPDAGFAFLASLALDDVRVSGARPVLLELIDMRRWKNGQVRAVRVPTEAIDAAKRAFRARKKDAEWRTLLTAAGGEHMRMLLREKTLGSGSAMPLELVGFLARFSGRLTRLASTMLLRSYFTPAGTFAVLLSNIPFAPGCAYHGSIGYRSGSPSMHLYLVFREGDCIVTFHVGPGMDAIPARVAARLRELTAEIRASLATSSSAAPSEP